MNNCKKCGLPIEEGQEYCIDCMPTEEEEVQIEELHECSVLENEEPTQKGGVFTTIAIILASVSIGIFVFGIVISVLLSLFGLGVFGSLLSGLASGLTEPLSLAALVLGIVACVQKEGKKGLVMGIIAFALPIALLIAGLAILLVILVIFGVFMFAFYLMEEVFYY